MEVLTGAMLLVGAVTGIVELVKRAVGFDWRVALIILAAGVAGWVLAPLPEVGLTSAQGLVIGFAASGYVTLAQNFGKSKTADLG